MRFFRRLQYPTTLLIALLQRAPVVRFAGLAEEVLSWSPVSAVLKSAVVLAGLGAVDTLAGASVTIRTNGSNPLSLKAGTAMSPVVFTISNSSDFPGSWSLLPGSTVPPGLTFGDTSGTPTLTGPGTFNTSGSNYYGTAVLTGTPTAAGTYTLNLAAYEYPNGASNGTNNDNTSPTYSYTITVTGSAISPVSITTQPTSQKVVSGSTVVFSVVASSSQALTYQWFLNGAALGGATSSRLVVAPATASNAGNYTCTVSNASGGTATTAIATLSIANTTEAANPARLVNLSVLTALAANQPLTVGLVTGGGSNGASQPLLIRGIGPALAAFGVNPAPMADPSLTLYRQSDSAIVGSDDNWGSNQSAVTAADAATGAFALNSPGSLDAAMVMALPTVTGGYSAIMSGNNGSSGSALAEFYDDTANYTSASPRLLNLSSRTTVAAHGNLTAGFVINGTAGLAKTLLIRAVGPSLAQFGVTGFMTDPQLILYNGVSAVLNTNAGWGSDAQIASVASSVGAFTLTSPSDSVLLITLPVGSYTAAASSISGTSGNVLIEVYEVP